MVSTLRPAVHLRLPAAPAAVEHDFLRLDRFQAADRSLHVTSRYLEVDGRPWLPVMGEFHFSRYPRAEWAAELRKMRAGGIAIVASYVFWNHHEAAPGEFDWRGDRDLRHFAELAQEAGLLFYLRPGPWVHAESRNGGFPDWLLATGELRCNAPGYLARVARFFGEIGAQLEGLMWRDGGPVIGVQLENEYDRVGPGAGAEHIAELKRLAIEAGLQVPLYTVTGWPTLDIPPREVIPVSGAYPDGFWSGEAGPLPPSGVFLFNTSRAIGEMGNVGGTPATAQIDKRHYPFFLAEAGGGMHVSYHRRPVVDADDLAATCLVQIGSGATLYGYYMYHGGRNPGPGLNETQDTGYPNDVPVLGYDFNAPLGQYGQRRVSYGRLRTLHLFLEAFGEELAPMEAALADDAPTDPADRERPRLAVRGAGDGGFLFANNHVRHHPMPDFHGLRIEVQGARTRFALPAIDIPSGASFIWPLGQRIGAATLHHATAQPLTRLAHGEGQLWVLFAHPAIPIELRFENEGLGEIDAPSAWIARDDHGTTVQVPASPARQWLRFTDACGTAHAFLLLDRAEAERCYRLPVLERDRLVFCAHGVHAEDGRALVVASPHDEATVVDLFPADDLAGGERIDGFARYTLTADARPRPEAAFAVRQDAQAAPEPRLGPLVAWRGRQVPLPPQDAQYEAAHRVELTIAPPAPQGEGRVLLEIDYVGDAARLYADGELIDDHFHDGKPWQVGIDRFVRDGRWPGFELRIVAANPALPIFVEAAAREAVAGARARAVVHSVRATWWLDRRLNLNLAAAPAVDHA